MKMLSCLKMVMDYMRCHDLHNKSPTTKVDEEHDEERKNMKFGGWKSVPYVIANESCERIATQGLAANFTIYLMRNYNMAQVKAANVSNIFSGTTNFAPLVGAFLSDAYFGRYRTLGYSTVATFAGMFVLTLSSVLPQLHPKSCTEGVQCPSSSHGQIAILILTLALLVIGAGGIRPTTVPFGVDQFDRTSVEGRRGLVSFFNWYYWVVNVAFLLAMSVVVYLQDSVSWAIGFGIPTGLLLVSTAFFLFGSKHYVIVSPEGSVLTGILQVFIAAFRKRKQKLPSSKLSIEEQDKLLYNNLAERSERVAKLPLSQQFRFLNKAALYKPEEINNQGFPTNPWRLCSVQLIEEVKCVIRIIPISLCGISTFVAISQLWTFAVLQSLVMDRHLGSHFQIPPGSLGVISLIALVLFLPMYDLVFMPVARKMTGHENGITLLQRQGVGMVISIISMMVAGLVELRRRNSAIANNEANGTSPTSVLWLTPQLALVGISEAFNAIGQVEFYNMEFPEHMQTMGGSLFYLGQALSSYISAFLVSIIQNKTGRNGHPNWLDNNINIGRLDYFYYLIGIYGTVSFLCFLVCAHFYRYKAKPELKDARKDIETSR